MNFYKTPTQYDDKLLPRLSAARPDLADKFGKERLKSIAGAGGGFGPVRRINIYIVF
jgi:hypothetical protein